MQPWKKQYKHILIGALGVKANFLLYVGSNEAKQQWESTCFEDIQQH